VFRGGKELSSDVSLKMGTAIIETSNGPLSARRRHCHEWASEQPSYPFSGSEFQQNGTFKAFRTKHELLGEDLLAILKLS
jgi:hypothetical protein